MRQEREELEKILVLKRASRKISDAYVRSRFKKQIAILQRDFTQPPNYNKGKPLPQLWKHKKYNSDVFLEKIHLMWWARKRVLALSPEGRALVRQKVLTADLFGIGSARKKPWDPKRSFVADYCGYVIACVVCTCVLVLYVLLYVQQVTLPTQEQRISNHK